MSDDELPSQPMRANDCADPAALLLPWYVNGTLSASDEQQVRVHLRDCVHCRDDLEQQQQLARYMQQHAVVELAPQPGLTHLLARVTAHGKSSTADDDMNGNMPTGPERRSRLTRWLLAAVLIQTVGLGALATVMYWPKAELTAGTSQGSVNGARNGAISDGNVANTAANPASAESSAVTTTSATLGTGNTHVAAATADQHALIRVMFSGQTSMQELRDLLGRRALCIVDGPNEAGLYTLRVDKAVPGDRLAAAHIVATTVGELRRDAHVVFAEPLTAKVENL